MDLGWIEELWNHLWTTGALMNYVFNLVILVIMGGIFNHIMNKKVEKIKFENARNLQVDNFYKNINEEEIKKTIDEWFDVILDMQNFSEKVSTEKFGDMLKRITLLGFERAIRISSIFQQHNFKNQNGDSKNDESYVLVYLLLEVICSIKYDFTGYYPDPEDLFNLKIEDGYKKVLEKE